MRVLLDLSVERVVKEMEAGKQRLPASLSRRCDATQPAWLEPVSFRTPAFR